MTAEVVGKRGGLPTSIRRASTQGRSSSCTISTSVEPALHEHSSMEQVGCYGAAQCSLLAFDRHLVGHCGRHGTLCGLIRVL